MTTDNDQAAVEAVQKAIDEEIELCDEHGDRFDNARAVLAAIRAGKVPWVRIAGDEECLPLERERNAKLRAEVEREKARADKAVAERDGLNQTIIESAELQANAVRWRTRYSDVVAERDRLADALRAVTDAYRFRFDVPGRGLCGPIDPEVEAAVSALAEVGK